MGVIFSAAVYTLAGTVGVLSYGVLPEAAFESAAQDAKTPAADKQPAQKPAAAPVVQDADGKPDAAFASAEALLDALEKADADLRTLSAQIVYERTFALMGDRQVRWGNLYYSDLKARDGQRVRKFAAKFNKLQIGSRLDDQDLLMIFDGRFFWEINYQDKVAVKREVVPEGEKWDPFKIGEGPMPVPIGQKKSDILARFNAELLSATAELEGDNDKETERLRRLVEGAVQLKLTPKEGIREAEMFKDVRLWYARGKDGRMLPRMARVENPTGDISLVQMREVEVNGQIPSEVLLPFQPPTGWLLQDVRLREQPAPQAPAPGR